MPNKLATDFRTKTPDELQTQLDELSKEQFNLRFQKANGQLENTARVRKVRRDIARTKSIISEKKAQAAKQKPTFLREQINAKARIARYSG